MSAAPLPARHFLLPRPFLRTPHGCALVWVGRGREESPGAYAYDNRRRPPVVLLQATLEGEGRFADDETGRTHAVGPGQALLAVFPSPTRYWLPENGRWTFLYAGFAGEAALYHGRELLRTHGPILSLAAESEPLRLLGRLYEDLLADAVPDGFAASALAYRLLMELYRSQRPPEADIPRPVERARRHIERHYDNPALGVADLAAMAGLSPYHFSRLFKKTVGRSPYACLLQTRMAKAAELLASTDLPVKGVAAAVGFRDCAYFCNVFRQHYRMTPGALRQANHA